MDIRSIQKPLKEQYRRDPSSSRITLTAKGSRKRHPVVLLGGHWPRTLSGRSSQRSWRSGTAACSGDLLLGALAACAQLTCQLVATAMGIPTQTN